MQPEDAHVWSFSMGVCLYCHAPPKDLSSMYICVHNSGGMRSVEAFGQHTVWLPCTKEQRSRCMAFIACRTNARSSRRTNLEKVALGWQKRKKSHVSGILPNNMLEPWLGSGHIIEPTAGVHHLQYNKLLEHLTYSSRMEKVKKGPRICIWAEERHGSEVEAGQHVHTVDSIDVRYLAANHHQPFLSREIFFFLRNKTPHLTDRCPAMPCPAMPSSQHSALIVCQSLAFFPSLLLGLTSAETSCFFRMPAQCDRLQNDDYGFCLSLLSGLTTHS